MIFGLFRKAPKALAREAVSAVLDGRPDAFARIEKRSRKDKVEAYSWLGRLLMLDDAWSEALTVLERAQALAPDDAGIEGAIAACRTALGDDSASEDHLRRQLEAHPANIEVRAALAHWAISRADYAAAEALLDAAPNESTQLELARAEVFFGRGEYAAARDLLTRVMKVLRSGMRSTLLTDEFEALRDQLIAADALHAELVALQDGQEAVVVDAAQRGDIAPNHPTNLMLLGQALMAKSERAGDPFLRSPQDRVAQGTPIALAEAALRDGRIDSAREMLQRLADAREFAGFLGLGWAGRHGDTWKFVRYLPAPADDPPWAPLLPGYACLNREERRIVAASIEPLAVLCPVMIERDVRIHILPLDARPSDLPGWGDLGGRTADHRAPDAIGGMARPSGAVVRLDELWWVGPKGTWTLGHEFAHLALFHMEPDDIAQVEALYDRALGVEYVGGDYQRQNVDEFFAVGYQDWLTRKHGGQGQTLYDDQKVVEDLDAFIEALAARA